MLTSRRFWLGVVVSAGFLVLFFWQIDLSKTADALRGANYWWLFPAIAAYFIAVLFRALRWRLLLAPLKSVPVFRLYPIVVVGYMANNLLPVRLGELVRAFFIGQKEGVDKGSALVTILVERVFDGVFLLILALVIWPFLPVAGLLRDFSDNIGIAQGLAVFLISAPFILVLAVFFAVALSPRAGQLVMRSALFFAPRRLKAPVGRVIGGLLLGVSALRSPRRVAAVALLTAPVWFAEATMYYIVSLGFRLDLPFHGLLLATSTSNLATSLPSSAGAVGPFEYATRLTLEGLNVAAELAAAYAIALHIVLLVPVTLFGLVFLWMQSMSLRDVIRAPGAKAEGAEAASQASTGQQDA